MYSDPEQHTFVSFIYHHLGPSLGKFAEWSYWLELTLAAMAETDCDCDLRQVVAAKRSFVADSSRCPGGFNVDQFKRCEVFWQF